MEDITLVQRYVLFFKVEQNIQICQWASRSIICQILRLRQIIDLRERPSQCFVIIVLSIIVLLFDHQVVFIF